MKKYIILFCTAMLFLLLCGCQSSKEINEMFIVAGLAVDAADDGQIEITAEIVDFGDTGSKSKTISAIGRGISDAISRLMLSSGKELYFSHANVIVIDKKIKKNVLLELFDYILRNNELRLTTYVVISLADSAKEILTVGESGVCSYELANLLDESKYTSMTVRCESYKAINSMSQVGNAILPTVSVDNCDMKLCGCAVFDKYKMIGLLSGEESIILNAIRNTADEFTLEVNCDNTKVSVRVIECKTRANAKLIDGIAAFGAESSLSLSIESIDGAYGEISVGEIESRVSDALCDRAESLFDKLKNEFKTDALGYIKILKATHPERYRTIQSDTDKVFENSTFNFSCYAEVIAGADGLKGE